MQGSVRGRHSGVKHAANRQHASMICATKKRRESVSLSWQGGMKKHQQFCMTEATRESSPKGKKEVELLVNAGGIRHKEEQENITLDFLYVRKGKRNGAERAGALFPEDRDNVRTSSTPLYLLRQQLNSCSSGLCSSRKRYGNKGSVPLWTTPFRDSTRSPVDLTASPTSPIVATPCCSAATTPVYHGTAQTGPDDKGRLPSARPSR
eukprot:gene1682-1044_t